MEIEFLKQRHEDFVNNFAKLSKKYGRGHADNIIKRMDALSGTQNLLELPKSFNFHKLKGIYKDTFAIDIDPSGKRGKERILFVAINDYQTDVSKINKIRIIEIFKDYH